MKKSIRFSPVLILVVILVFIIVYLGNNYFLGCGQYFGQASDLSSTESLVLKLSNGIPIGASLLWLLFVLIGLGLSIIELAKGQTWGERASAISSLFLVVVLGFLTQVVITSLGQGRPRAREASAQASISSMKLEAEKFWTGEKKFGIATNSCDTPDSVFANLSPLINAAQKNLKEKMKCISNSENWAVSAKIPQGGGGGMFCPKKSTFYFYCVDSSGFGGKTTSEITGPVCPH